MTHTQPGHPVQVGITGTRHGITRQQENTLAMYLLQLARGGSLVLHHGDCVGADATAANFAKRFGLKLHCHPPILDIYRAHVESDTHDQPARYFTRNRNIVHCSDLLIACPKDALPKTTNGKWSGGTWSTVQYAFDTNTAVAIIQPGGSTVYRPVN